MRVRARESEVRYPSLFLLPNFRSFDWFIFDLNNVETLTPKVLQELGLAKIEKLTRA